MKPQALLLLHGMGNFTAPGEGPGAPKRGSFGEEFVKASTVSLRRYREHKTQTLEDHVDLFEFNYDVWFDKMRTQMADRAKSMTGRLDAVAASYGVTFAMDLVGRLTDLEADFGAEDFFHTHWLDVIFYTTMLGAKVRVDTGRKIAELVETYGTGNVHIMAHSLGTAVLHDTLHLLYRPESDPMDEIPDLHPVNHKLASVWMVANVSRLVNAFTSLADPLKSVVKPGDDGCCAAFFNVRHALDPFTWLSRFAPANNGSWVPEAVYASSYADIVTQLVLDPNTHSFTQYLQDPEVAERFLYQLTPFDVTPQEMKAVNDAYAAGSINGAYAALEEAFHGLNVKEIQSWREFLQAGQALDKAVKRIREGL